VEDATLFRPVKVRRPAKNILKITQREGAALAVLYERERERGIRVSEHRIKQDMLATTSLAYDLFICPLQESLLRQPNI